MIARLRPACWLMWAVASLSLAACGGEDVVACFDDRTCGAGQRCTIAVRGQAGVCTPCAAEEIPYDGIDNDCSTRTPDLDLDRDGDNAQSSPVAPGRDCDDEDAEVGAALAEVCGDGKDNDCDGQADELDCGDRNPPAVRFLTPVPGALLSRGVSLRVEATDDVGVVELSLEIGGQVVAKGVQPPAPMQQLELDLDSARYPDGLLSVRAVAVDVRGRTGVTTLDVTLDNRNPPTVSIAAPQEARSYAGLMRVEVDASDPSGLDRVELSIDGVEVDVLTQPPYVTYLETADLEEGMHNLGARAVDGLGNASESKAPFLVDRTGPQLAFAAPTTGTIMQKTFEVKVVAVDSAGIAMLESEGRSTSEDRIAYAIDTRSLPNGTISFRASAEDATLVDDGLAPGNASAVEVIARIENQDERPQVTIVQPTLGDSVFRTMLLEASATSPIGAAIEQVEFLVDGVRAGIDIIPDARGRFSIDHPVPPGEATLLIEARARDALGAVGTATVSVTSVVAPTFRLARQFPVPGTLGAAGYDFADFNGDGVLDAVTTGTALAIHPGRITRIGARGRFGLGLPVIVSQESLLDVRAVDLDNDGDQDFVVLSASGLRAHVNDGMGRFPAGPVATAPQTGLVAFDCGDLDGDLDPDCVVGGGTVAGAVFTYANGAFSLAQTLGGNGSVSDVVVADVDADGDRDVVFGRTGAGNTLVTVYRNGGSASFGAGQDSFTNQPPEQVVVADVSGDGYPDLVVAQPGNDSFRLMLGSQAAPGNFTAGTSYFTQLEPRGLAVGDVDGDAVLDVVVTPYQANGIEIWSGGSGTFRRTRTYVVTQNPRRPQLLDLDGDGDREVICSGPGESSLAVAENLGGGNFFAAPAVLLAERPTALAVGNVLGDALPDLLFTVDRNGSAVPPSPPRVLVLENRTGSFVDGGALPLPNSMSPPTSLALGELDGAPGLDLAVGSSVLLSGMPQPTAALLLNNGNGTFRSRNVQLNRPQWVALGDVDDDGQAEAVFTQQGPDGAAVVEVAGGAPRTVVAGTGPIGVAVADLDLDGQPDFAVGNGVTHDVTVNLSASGGWITTTYNAPNGFSALAIGLVNRDALPDVIGVATTGVFVMDGSTQFGFSTPRVFPAGRTPTRLLGGDFNGDGLYDVVVLNADDRAAVLIARPQGGFFEPFFISLGRGPVQMVSGDFDGDGAADIAVGYATVAGLMLIYSDGDRL
jgi:hypothetical protein